MTRILGRTPRKTRVSRGRVLMVVEALPLAADPRLRRQAEVLLADRFEVTVICPRHPRNSACVPGVRVLQYPAPPQGSSLVAFAAEYLYSLAMAGCLACWEFVRRGFDVLQTGNPPDVYFTVAALFKWMGVPVVFDFRDPSPETYAARSGRTAGPVYRTLLALEWRSFRMADRVLVVNESLRQIAHSRGGVDDDRIVTVGAGPESSRVMRRTSTPELRAGRAHLCCWVGLMGPQDRVDLAVSAAAQLVHERSRTDCAFAFVGAGEALPAARQQAAALGISDFVSFPGWVQRDRVFDYLSTADLGIEPNTEDYISPVKVMEYMAAGLPVVAFDTRETVQLAADAARYAPKGDVRAMAGLLDELLDADKTRAQMARSGQQRIRDSVAWEHQARRYVAVFRDLGTRGSRPSWLSRLLRRARMTSKEISEFGRVRGCLPGCGVTRTTMGGRIP